MSWSAVDYLHSNTQEICMSLHQERLAVDFFYSALIEAGKCVYISADGIKERESQRAFGREKQSEA